MSCGSSTGARTPTVPTWCWSTWGRIVARPARPRGPSQPLPGRPPGHRGRTGPGLRPCPGAGAPGYQAGQPSLRRGGTGTGGRLRRRPGAGRGGLHRAGGGHGGDRPLHLAGVGRGQAGRRPGRRVLAGPGALRGALGHGSLRDRHDPGHAGGAGRVPPPPARGAGAPRRRTGVGRRPPGFGPARRRRASRPAWVRLASAPPAPAPLPLHPPEHVPLGAGQRIPRSGRLGAHADPTDGGGGCGEGEDGGP